MFETLIAILMALGLNFGKTNDGRILLSADSKATLISSDAYAKSKEQSKLLDIVVTDDDDPLTDIVVTDDDDPAR
jgi:hypothetical protein